MKSIGALSEIHVTTAVAIAVTAMAERIHTSISTHATRGHRRMVR
jgi:hypothetical protein